MVCFTLLLLAAGKCKIHPSNASLKKLGTTSPVLMHLFIQSDTAEADNGSVRQDAGLIVVSDNDLFASIHGFAKVEMQSRRLFYLR